MSIGKISENVCRILVGLDCKVECSAVYVYEIWEFMEWNWFSSSYESLIVHEVIPY